MLCPAGYAMTGLECRERTGHFFGLPCPGQSCRQYCDDKKMYCRRLDPEAAGVALLGAMSLAASTSFNTGLLMYTPAPTPAPTPLPTKPDNTDLAAVLMTIGGVIGGVLLLMLVGSFCVQWYTGL